MNQENVCVPPGGVVMPSAQQHVAELHIRAAGKKRKQTNKAC